MSRVFRSAPSGIAPRKSTSLFELNNLSLPLDIRWLLPIFAAVEFFSVFLAGSLTDQGLRYLLILIGTVAALSIGLLALVIVPSFSSKVAPLLLLPYGRFDLKRARQLISDFINGPKVPFVLVNEGKLLPGEGELLEFTNLGPATIYVDSESSGLIQRPEQFEILRPGQLNNLRIGDFLAGVVDLRPQSEPLEMPGLLTRDIMAVDIKGSFSYQLKQDEVYLDNYRLRQTTLRTLSLALLPKDRWREQTKAAVESKIREVISQQELWQLYMVRPAFPSAMNSEALAGLGQGFMPPNVRQDLQRLIQERATELTKRWGVEVKGVVIKELVAPREIRERAHKAYMEWLDRIIQVEEAERQAQVELRVAKSKHEQAELAQKTEIVKAETHAKAEQTQAKIQKETVQLRAEAKVIQAQKEAEAIREVMQAKTDSGVELARQLELLQRGTGRDLDDRVMREFLRAIGFLEPDSKHENESSRWVKLLRSLEPELPEDGERLSDG